MFSLKEGAQSPIKISDYQYQLYPLYTCGVRQYTSTVIQFNIDFNLKDHICRLELLPVFIQDGIVANSITFSCGQSLSLPVYWAFYSVPNAMSSLFAKDIFYFNCDRAICNAWITKVA